MVEDEQVSVVVCANQTKSPYQCSSANGWFEKPWQYHETIVVKMAALLLGFNVYRTLALRFQASLAARLTTRTIAARLFHPRTTQRL